MKIIVSQKKKLAALVALFVFGVAGLASFITRQILKYDALSKKEIWEWMVLPDFLGIVVIFSIITVYSYLHVNKKISVLIDEAMESLASGILHFDAKGHLEKFNPAAALMLPDLCEDEGSDYYIGAYKKFLAYVYDHSLDIQDQSRLTIDMGHMDPRSRLLFREVIEIAGRRIVLVQFYQRPSSDIVVILTDISLMKHHIDKVESLTDENTIMIQAIDASGNGMVIGQMDDLASKIIFANENFSKMMDVPEQKLLLESLYDILEEKFKGQGDAIRSGALAARSSAASQTVWLKTQSERKDTIWYAMTILFFVDAGDKEFLVCFLSDQTRVRTAQAEAHKSRSLEAVSRLAGGIAHSFNNVLSVIEGYSRLAQKGAARGDDVAPLLEQIHLGVKRGSRIAGQLLAFGRFRVAHSARLNICEQVRELEDSLVPMMDQSVNMILSIQEEACHINAPPDAIVQIVTALAVNARDAMPDGGDLIISIAEASRAQLLPFRQQADPSRSYVCLQVIDSGTGIDPDVLAHVYEPFFTTKQPAKNPGLGLSLVYGLVKDIGAMIDIKSTPGIGTSVSVLIPLEPAEKDSLFTGGKDERKNLELLEGKTILIAEVSPSVRDMEAKLLEAAGLTVLKADNAGDIFALHESYRKDIDFLLIDTDMNGLELSEIFALKRPQAKIILVSSYPESESLNHKTVLAKPLVYERLEEILLESLSPLPGETEKNAYWDYRDKVF